MFSTTSFVGENLIQDYLNYASKTKEIEFVNVGSKKLYQIYLNNLNKNKHNLGLVTNHKSALDTLLASYGQEKLVEVNGKQVRRLVLDLDNVNYKDLQDHLLGDFVFIDNNTKHLIVIDTIDYKEDSPNLVTTKYIRKKLMKLKKRCHMYKHLASESVGKGSYYISILWNSRSDLDLLEFIEQSHEQNKQLRSKYSKAKAAGDLTEVAKILTQIHVKTNIDLTELTFDVTERIY